MKTIKEIEEIQKNSFQLVNQGIDRKVTRIVIGMGTCGISAGADAVFEAIKDEVEKLGLNVIVAKTGCIGFCKLEPIIEVIKPGEEKTTYVKMTPYKARRIIASHVLADKPISEFMIHVVKGKILNDFVEID